MAISVAGNASGSAFATSRSIDVSGLGIQVGDTLVAFTAWFSNVGTDTISDPTDSTGGSNTWSTPAQSAWSATFREAVGVSYCVVASVPTTVTVKIGTRTEGLTGLVLRVTGAHAATPYDTSSANTSTSTNPTHTAITTAEANEMILCAGGYDSGGITVASDTASGWSTDIEVDPSNTYADLFESHKIIATASSGNAMAWQNSGSKDWGLAAIALKAAAGPNITVPAAAATAAVIAPTPSIGITTPVSTATASITAPAVLSAVSIAVPAAGATSTVVISSASAAIGAPRATATAAITPPVITNPGAGANLTITVPAAEARSLADDGNDPAPWLESMGPPVISIALTTPVASATAAVSTPAVSINLTIPQATATATMTQPSQPLVGMVRASATAGITAPTVTVLTGSTNLAVPAAAATAAIVTPLPQITLTIPQVTAAAAVPTLVIVLGPTLTASAATAAPASPIPSLTLTAQATATAAITVPVAYGGSRNITVPAAMAATDGGINVRLSIENPYIPNPETTETWADLMRESKIPEAGEVSVRGLSDAVPSGRRSLY